MFLRAISLCLVAGASAAKEPQYLPELPINKLYDPYATWEIKDLRDYREQINKVTVDIPDDNEVFEILFEDGKLASVKRMKGNKPLARLWYQYGSDPMRPSTQIRATTQLPDGEQTIITRDRAGNVMNTLSGLGMEYAAYDWKQDGSAVVLHVGLNRLGMDFPQAFVMTYFGPDQRPIKETVTKATTFSGNPIPKFNLTHTYLENDELLSGYTTTIQGPEGLNYVYSRSFDNAQGTNKEYRLPENDIPWKPTAKVVNITEQEVEWDRFGLWSKKEICFTGSRTICKTRLREITRK